jgi:hypothetical protein
MGKNKVILVLVILFNKLAFIAQTPQNIDRGKGRGESIWDSPWTIAFLVGFVVLMIVSRTWSKRIHQKRDNESEKNKKEE